MQVRITMPAGVLSATLDDNPTARDFWAMLPLKLALEDYEGTEKVGMLARHLSMESAPEGAVPEAGDVAYYAPWGNVALFYRGADHAHGLVRIGRLEGDLKLLTQSLSYAATIERESSA